MSADLTKLIAEAKALQNELQRNWECDSEGRMFVRDFGSTIMRLRTLLPELVAAIEESSKVLTEATRHATVIRNLFHMWADRAMAIDGDCGREIAQADDRELRKLYLAAKKLAALKELIPDKNKNVGAGEENDGTH